MSQDASKDKHLSVEAMKEALKDSIGDEHIIPLKQFIAYGVFDRFTIATKNVTAWPSPESLHGHSRAEDMQSNTRIVAPSSLRLPSN